MRGGRCVDGAGRDVDGDGEVVDELVWSIAPIRTLPVAA